MDYTDLGRVKQALGASESADDDLLNRVIADASREIDRRCTGASGPDVVDYFLHETVTDEICRAVVDVDGSILAYPHKPYVSSVTAFAYRTNPRSSWVSAPADYIVIDAATVVAWVGLAERPHNMQVKLSYAGGFADRVDDLPADLVQACTTLAIRFYREMRTGLSDSIGVAELGTIIYTKAIPVRVAESLRQYQRISPW